MYTLIIALIVIASIALILVVLVQKSKGSGLASGFSSSNNIMGVRKTTDVVEKTTWGLAIVICILSLASARFLKNSANTGPATMIEAPVIPTNNATPDVSTPFTMPSNQPQEQPAPAEGQN